MKNVKKKLISLLIFICMVSVLLPIQAPVYAESTYGDYVVAVYYPGTLEYTEGSALRLTGEGRYNISMASGVTSSSIPIIVDTNADTTIVLNGVNISSDTTPPITIYDEDDSHTVTIRLNGTNTLTSTYSDYTTNGMAGLEKQSLGELVITSYDGDGYTSGSLTVTGGYRGAGIGGGMYAEYFDNITIKGGTVIATGGDGAAGIGGGGYYYEEIDFYTTTHPSHGSGIKITGGNVTATGTGGGAGIGSGNKGSFTDIEISGGTVTAYGSENAAGIGGTYLSDYGHTSNDIKITGGTVTATGGENAAGIGGNSGVTGSEIAISDCTVTATGGENGAGIGGGNEGGGTGISISESTVTATGGANAAGIGGGSGGDGSNISITSGYIKTDVSGDGSDIGAGYGGTSSDLTITGGCFNAETDDVTLGENGSVYGISVGSDRTVYKNEDVSNGSTYPYFVSDTCDLKVETDASAGYGTGYGYGYGGDLKIQLVILTGGEFTISMADGIESTSYDRIYVASDTAVTVKLNNLNIESSSSPPLDINAVGDVTIELINDNTLNSTVSDSAGLQKSSTDNLLEIRNADDDNPGSLTATGGYQAAGIGGGYGGAGSNITITGGTIEAAGGWSELSYGGAGIGGGYCGAGSNITITGGTITATGGVSVYYYSGAGIGGGCYGSGSNITITGGTVTATGRGGGAGIGGGQEGEGSNIAISGGTVVADAYTSGNEGGAAIGGGYAGAGNNIEISGGDVTATGSTWYAAGIGGGYSSRCDGIVISGGTVTASGAMAIGGEHGGGTITISGGYLNLSRGGNSPGAYIGCNSGYSATVSITGGYFADESATTGSGGTVYDVTVADDCTVYDSGNSDYPYVVVSGADDIVVTTDVADGYEWTYSDGMLLTISEGGEYTLSMKTAGATSTLSRVKVTASDAVTITLDGVGIECSVASPFEIDGTGDVTLKLSGTSVLTSTAENYAGLQKTNTFNTLTITSAAGDGSAEGILTATGGTYGAGIGGGSEGEGSHITINGGTITATGGTNGEGIGGGYNGSASGIKIYNASVKASSIGTTPMAADGETSVYLYTIPDTVEGDSIQVDGEEIITSVVHHASDDANQYLYLPSDSEYAYTGDTVYSLSYADGNTSVTRYGNVGFAVEANSALFDSVPEGITLVSEDADNDIKDYVGKPLITITMANNGSIAAIESYTVTVSGLDSEGELSFTPTKDGLFNEGNYYMAQLIGGGIKSGGAYPVSVTIKFTVNGKEAVYTYTSSDSTVTIADEEV